MINGEHKTHTRRQIRRAFGPEALGVIDNHAEVLDVLQQQTAHLKRQMDALLDGVAQAARTQQQRQQDTSTFWKRLRWLVRGY